MQEWPTPHRPQHRPFYSSRFASCQLLCLFFFSTSVTMLSFGKLTRPWRSLAFFLMKGLSKNSILPTWIIWYRARVIATLRRFGESKNPGDRVLTYERITTSASCPWNRSEVHRSIDMFPYLNGGRCWPVSFLSRSRRALS